MGRRALWWVLLAAVLAAAGCGARRPAASLPPLDPAALADPSLRGARAALDQYLAARVAGDYDRVYQVLSPRSQQQYDAETLKQFFSSYVSYKYTSVGDPQQPQPGWARFPVQGVRWELKGRPPVEGEFWWVTVHYDGGRWGVAFADPLYPRALQAEQQGDADTLMRVATAMIQVDPYSFRGHLKRAHALLLSSQPVGAAQELDVALAMAPPPGRPEVARAVGDFFLLADDGRNAARYYAEAVEGMNRYQALYRDEEVAAANRNLAQSRLLAGDLEGARAAAALAQIQNPFDLRAHALALSLAAR